MAISGLFDVPAPAKLNLFLHVTGRRADGYHLLDSLMVLIDWCDTLHLERRGDGRLARHDRGATLPDDDLCLKAARALQQASQTPFGVDMTIEKRIPWAAGLGGGSSDAATTLLALNRLWGLDWPLERLLPVGLALGADVPFFLAGANARVAGIGERIEPVALAPAWFAVVKPEAGLATGAVFASPRVARPASATPAAEGGAARIPGFSAAAPDLPGGFGRNDLQAAAEDLCPDVARAAAGLVARFGNSRMTGSGSAVFARVGQDEASAGAWPAGWTSRICRSLERHPLAGWARRGV